MTIEQLIYGIILMLAILALSVISLTEDWDGTKERDD